MGRWEGGISIPPDIPVGKLGPLSREELLDCDEMPQGYG
jgi:hypothetical protein